MNENYGDVCILGLGYVGLTLAATLAELGFRVYGVDPDDDVLKSLRNQKAFFHEEGIDKLLEKHLGKSLFFQKRLGVSLAPYYIIAVSTPLDADNNVSFIQLKNTCFELGNVLRKRNLVILRSTVSVGASSEIVIPLLEKHSSLKVGDDFDFVFAPERTIEGAALKELLTLPQILGGFNQRAVDRAREFFLKLTPDVIAVNSLESAEMIKLISNTFRDLTFSFANAVSMACAKYNINPHEVIKAANLRYDRNHIPIPSPGVGGYCLTKDPRIFARSFKDLSDVTNLVEAGRAINSKMPHYVIKIMRDFFLIKKRKNLRGANISVLGMAFKGNPPTSDIRFSPSMDVVNLLIKEGANLKAHDYVVPVETIKNLFIEAAESVEDAFEDSEAVIIMTNHPYYRHIDVTSLLRTMDKPALLFDPWQLHFLSDIQKISDIYYSNLGFNTFI